MENKKATGTQAIKQQEISQPDCGVEQKEEEILQVQQEVEQKEEEILQVQQGMEQKEEEILQVQNWEQPMQQETLCMEEGASLSEDESAASRVEIPKKEKREGQKGRIPRYIKEKLKNWRRGIQNYPLTWIASTAIFVLLVHITNQEQWASDGPHENAAIRWAMALGIGGIAAISFMWIGRAWLKSEKKALVFTGALMAILSGGTAAYLAREWGFVQGNAYGGTLLFFVVLYLALPFRLEKGRVEQNLIDTAGAFFQGMLFAAVFYLGTVATLATVRYLFHLHFISWKYFVYTFYFAVFVLGAHVFLSELSVSEEGIDIRPLDRVSKTLLLWIVLPIFAVYTAILYAYFLRILILRTWPQGMVSHMVLWYSALSVFFLLILNPLRQERKRAAFFCQFFPWMAIPVMGMMFASMGIRIRQYGVTESRYYVLALGVWVLFSVLWYGRFQGRKNAGIFVGLCVMIWISIWSPVSSFSVSKYSQNQLLRQVLEKNSMLENGKIVAGKEVSDEDQKRVREVLRYFHQYHSFKEVTALPQGFTEETSEKTLGFALNSNEDGYKNADMRHINVYMERSYKGAVDIEGYKVFSRQGLADSTLHSAGEYQIQIRDHHFLKIKNTREEISLDLQKITWELAKKQMEAEMENKGVEAPLEDCVFQGEGNGISWKIVVSNLYGKMNRTTWEMEGLQFLLFLK